MKVVLIGAGQRGRIYADYMQSKGYAEISAIIEPNEERREAARIALNVPKEQCYINAAELFSKGKQGDAVIIASMDRDHYAQAMQAIEQGYDILLEKPISPNPKECVAIAKRASEKGCIVVVCHVLRYTPFFTAIKKILDSGELGRIMSIQHNENIGSFHIAHSFVRGNWGNSDISSPIIMQKSCHDMDILVWLTGSEAEKIVSFGDLRYFRKENAPVGSTGRCCDCKVQNCHFDAYKAYLPMVGEWPACVVCPTDNKDELQAALITSQYGRCVFHCDNNVCDTQVSLIKFKNGVNVTFNLSGFTNKMCRTLKIMCEYGEIRAADDTNCIEVTHFTANMLEEVESRVTYTAAAQSGHGGGDAGIVEDFYRLMLNKNGESISSVNRSIESHLMAYAAEKSRVENKIINMDDLHQKLSIELK